VEQQETKLPLEWLSSRRTPELHRLEQLCRETAREQRCAQRRLQEVEEAMASDTEKLRPDAVPEEIGPQTQLEQLSRKLNAANAELRRYETRMFAYERTMLALRKENAELTAQCEVLRHELDELIAAPKQPSAVPASEIPALPVIEFPQDAAKKQSAPEKKADSTPDKQPPKQQKTKLEHLSDEVLAQLAQLMPKEE